MKSAIYCLWGKYLVPFRRYMLNKVKFKGQGHIHVCDLDLNFKVNTFSYFYLITDMPSLMIFILFQVVIQSGQSPTILQQMCSLPFHYFSDPRLTTILFPTLIACCYNNQSNREILEQELSCVLLSNFIEVYIYIFQIHTLRPFLPHCCGCCFE